MTEARIDQDRLEEVRRLLDERPRGRLLPSDELVLSNFLHDAGELEERSEEVDELVARVRSRFVEGNIGLVVSVARRFQGSGCSFEDLVQEGTIGLLRAVDLYDGRRGFRFSTYATWWIRQAIAQAVARSRGEVVLPRGVRSDLARVERARRELEQRLGREPRARELAAASGLDELRVRELLGYARAALSLDQRIGEDAETTYADLVADRDAEPIEQTIEHDDLRTIIAAALEHLDEREREVLAYRFGLGGHEPHTLEDAAAHFGIARERIRQIEARAITRLRRGEAGPVLRRVLES